MGKLTHEQMIGEILEIVYQINLENSKKSTPHYTLADMLNAKNITSLRKMGKLYGVRGFSKMGKKEIIPELIKNMTNKKQLTDCLFLLNDLEWDLFRKAANAKDINGDKVLSEDLMFLLELGYMELYYGDGHFLYIVPNEIKAVYQELVNDGFLAEKQRLDLLNDYAIAATNLYGLITQEDFVEIFNKQNKHKTTVDEIFATLIKFVATESGYCFWEGYLVNDDFAENDFKDVEYYAKTAAMKPRYLPPQSEFLQYSDWNYIEPTPQLTALRNFIRRELSNDPNLLEELMEGIVSLSRYEAKLQMYIDLFEENDISFSNDRQMQTLVQHIIEVKNNTRLWLNNGHKPTELFDKEKKYLTPVVNKSVQVIKIGRNEPCPCGSGNKYKKCCGK